MKHRDYRLLVLLIIFTVSISIGLKLVLAHLSPGRTAMTINDKTISEKQFNRMFSKKPYLQNMDDFIHSVIIKELLIQEAIKAGIQREEAFRQSIQDFYEQSLIKIIMDRKYTDLEPHIDETLIDRYMTLCGKTMDLTLLTYKTPEDIVKEKVALKESISLPFTRLSIEVRYDLLRLKPGDVSSPSFSEIDNVYSVFRLDTINPGEPMPDTNDNREIARQLLTEHQKELMLADWLEALKARANVSLGSTVTQEK